MSADQPAQRITLRRTDSRIAGARAFVGRAWKRRWVRWLAILAAIPVVLYFILWLLFARGLPSAESLLSYEPILPTYVRDVNGAPVQSFARERRVQLAYEEFPVPLINAFLAAEDRTFFSHSGIDYPGMVGAVWDYVSKAGSGERARGGSTITQQVAKIFFVGDEYSVTRKIREAFLARRIESALSKEQILELYLNQIFLGRNAYGVQAAARAYFNKDVGQLSVAECAFLAILPKSPSNYDPVRHHDRALQRRNFVLNEMLRNNFITRAQYDEALATPIETARGTGQDSTRHVGGYFMEEVRRNLIERYGESASPDHPNSVYAGGLWVRTSYNAGMPRLDAPARLGRLRFRRPAPRRGDRRRAGRRRRRQCLGASLHPRNLGRDGGRGGRLGPGPRDAGRLGRSRRELQPRHPGAAPARIDVQADRLFGGARQRNDTRLDHHRRPVLHQPGHAAAEMLPQLLRRLCRPADDALGPRTVAQPDDGAHRQPDRNDQRRSPRAPDGSRRLPALSRHRAGRRGDDRVADGQRLRYLRQSGPGDDPDADRLYPGPPWARDLAGRHPSVRGLQRAGLERAADASPAASHPPGCRSDDRLPDRPHARRRRPARHRHHIARSRPAPVRQDGDDLRPDQRLVHRGIATDRRRGLYGLRSAAADGRLCPGRNARSADLPPVRARIVRRHAGDPVPCALRRQDGGDRPALRAPRLRNLAGERSARRGDLGSVQARKRAAPHRNPRGDGPRGSPPGRRRDRPHRSSRQRLLAKRGRHLLGPRHPRHSRESGNPAAFRRDRKAGFPPSRE